MIHTLNGIYDMVITLGTPVATLIAPGHEITGEIHWVFSAFDERWFMIHYIGSAGEHFLVNRKEGQFRVLENSDSR